MKKSILIGISIVTVTGILLGAIALGFGDTGTKATSFKSDEIEKNTSDSSAFIESKNETEIKSKFRPIELSEKGKIQYAQSNVSFRIIEPLYIPAGYNLESVEGKKFTGVATDIDMASFSFINGNETFSIKETIVVKSENTTKSSTLTKDTREIIDLNGIEGRYSEENGIKLLNWKFGNLSLSIRSWKNEGQNQTGSSLSKEDMINLAKYVREKTPEEGIADAQAKVSFEILQTSYIPEGYRMNTAQTSGTKFRGVSSELEQASLYYIKGDEFFAKNEYLILKELLTIKDDTDVSERTSNIPWKYMDINGIQGQFLEEPNGVKSLNWKTGNLSLTISSYAYNESGSTGTSLSMEEIIKMARSIK